MFLLWNDSTSVTRNRRCFASSFNQVAAQLQNIEGKESGISQDREGRPCLGHLVEESIAERGEGSFPIPTSSKFDLSQGCIYSVDHSLGRVTWLPVVGVL